MPLTSASVDGKSVTGNMGRSGGRGEGKGKKGYGGWGIAYSIIVHMFN